MHAIYPQQLLACACGDNSVKHHFISGDGMLSRITFVLKWEAAVLIENNDPEGKSRQVISENKLKARLSSGRPCEIILYQSVILGQVPEKSEISVSLTLPIMKID